MQANGVQMQLTVIIANLSQPLLVLVVGGSTTKSLFVVVGSRTPKSEMAPTHPTQNLCSGIQQ